MNLSGSNFSLTWHCSVCITRLSQRCEREESGREVHTQGLCFLLIYISVFIYIYIFYIYVHNNIIYIYNKLFKLV